MSDEGYEFVPLPASVRRAERPHARHDMQVRDAITAAVSVALVTEQPLHVGSGFKTLRDGRVVRAMVRSGEAPCVPGSTLKGVLRSRFEAITKSCALFRPNDRPESVRSSSFPGARARYTESVLRGDVFRVCGASGPSCAACALFGRMSLRGRVSVTDFVPAAAVETEVLEVAEMFSPNLHHVGSFTPREEYGKTVLEVHRLHGRKFARGRGPEAQGRERVEVVPVGTTFVGTLRLQNVTPDELGGLWAALGIDPSSRLKVGGAKGHGLGRMRVGHTEVAHRGGVRVDVARCVAAFQQSDDRWSDGLDALVRIHGEQAKP